MGIVDNRCKDEFASKMKLMSKCLKENSSKEQHHRGVVNLHMEQIDNIQVASLQAAQINQILHKTT